MYLSCRTLVGILCSCGLAVMGYGIINVIRTSKFITAEQELVDCDVRGGNNGCNGRFTTKAYMCKSGGLNTAILSLCRKIDVNDKSKFKIMRPA